MVNASRRLPAASTSTSSGLRRRIPSRSDGWVWHRVFPSLEVQRLEQSYERLAERRYRYRSGRFTADLAVDDDGMVLQYGVNWKAVATSGELA
jgi:hypothetical protein